MNKIYCFAAATCLVQATECAGGGERSTLGTLDTVLDSTIAGPHTQGLECKAMNSCLVSFSLKDTICIRIFPCLLCLRTALA